MSDTPREVERLAALLLEWNENPESSEVEFVPVEVWAQRMAKWLAPRVRLVSAGERAPGRTLPRFSPGFSVGRGGPIMVQDHDGAYVRHDDVVRLLGERAAGVGGRDERALLTELRDWFANHCDGAEDAPRWRWDACNFEERLNTALAARPLEEKP
jgi:hypothetical protein